MNRPCDYGHCVATVNGKPREFCPLHQPDQVRQRARKIVSMRFEQMVKTEASNKQISQLLFDLRDVILQDLESTV